MDEGEEARKRRIGALSDAEKVAIMKRHLADPDRHVPEILWKGSSSPEEISRGLRRIRNWRHARAAAWVGLMVLGVSIDLFAWRISPAVAGAILLGVVMSFEAVLTFVRCPRCGHEFSKLGRTAAQACAHCGLPLHEGSRGVFW